MTRNEFIQQCAISMRSNGRGHVEAWTDATQLADAAPKGTFDAPQATTRSAPSSSGSATGAVFPPFGQSKGEPIHGASEKTLRFYAHASMRTLGDPDKARFHDKERTMLAAYVNELERQGKDAAEFDVRRPQAGDPRGPEYERRPGPNDPGPNPDDIPF